MNGRKRFNKVNDYKLKNEHDTKKTKNIYIR